MSKPYTAEAHYYNPGGADIIRRSPCDTLEQARSEAHKLTKNGGSALILKGNQIIERHSK